MKAWYLIYSKPRQERLALENLQRQGYETYLPLMRNRRRRKGRSLVLIEPMFPRYLFTRLSADTDNWGPIRSTLGVAHLVRFGDAPAQVPDSLISTLRAQEDADGIQEPPKPDFRRGDKVRIVDGAMAGYEAIYYAKTSHERVVLLLEIVGRSAPVQLSANSIERIL
ncbi:MAG: transcription/translation regulatory transformer protein RfaH [Gammaproteobacteria bacterium]|nr:transcription/translation regulatory transformer protein RfaH [Gammaproteobacteria bacterium]MCI0591182.1 transcription/translation regulatory transformer protein RfaH [Gammaproteobacteria bacterium]